MASNSRHDDGPCAVADHIALDGPYLDPPESALSDDLTELVLALADDELLMGQQHTNWLGLAPFLEEDLATASIGQDEIGHARALYAVVWPGLDSDDRDALVVRRRPAQWRSAALTEIDGRPWERHLVRHWLYDRAEPARWTEIAEAIPALRPLADKVLIEEAFHRRHADDLVDRLRRGSDDARRRIDTELEQLEPLLLQPDRRTRHAHFAELHGLMLEVFRFDPAARW